MRISDWSSDVCSSDLTDTGKVARIGYSNEYFGEAEMNPTKTIIYPASDGEKIHAVVTMPRHREGQRNLPVVMITHGGPFGPRDEEGFGPFAWHQAIAELGYVVVQDRKSTRLNSSH